MDIGVSAAAAVAVTVAEDIARVLERVAHYPVLLETLSGHDLLGHRVCPRFVLDLV